MMNILNVKVHLGKVFLCVLFLAVLASPSVQAQERLYWEFPEILGSSMHFPVFVGGDDNLAVVWQEFSGTPGVDAETYINVKARFSSDGDLWGEIVSIAENVPYTWQKKVPLFSVAKDVDGRLTVALSVEDKRINFYRENFSNTFVPLSSLSVQGEVVEVIVAPRLVARKGGGFLLFLTRSLPLSTVEGGSENFTIWYTESDDGRQWAPVKLFVRPGVDLASDGSELRQNFLPAYLSSPSGEYVVFQSSRAGRRTYTYQIYLKLRKNGGDWGTALPITESLIPRTGETNPLEWDNQRPSLALDIQGQILMAWERYGRGFNPAIAAVVISTDGTVSPTGLEEVSNARGLSAYPRVFLSRNQTWLLWFDTTGIRLARRDALDTYSRTAEVLDSAVPGKELGSSSYAQAEVFKGNVFLLWQDSRAGIPRAIFLKPDRNIEIPRYAGGVLDGEISRNPSVRVAWRGREDSSGILSYSWLWSQDPNSQPSRNEADQVYGSLEAVETLEEEGLWYFSLIAQDRAGNWSDPLKLTYKLDRTPPAPPHIVPPETDAFGYLLSNTFTLTWQDAEEEDVEAYLWRFDYLSENTEDLSLGQLLPEVVQARNTREVSSSNERSATMRNGDNGLWAFSVSTRDKAGNVGLPSVQILPLKRYIPVTYITGGNAENDDMGSLTFRLFGRGFAVGGLIQKVILDTDGIAPWDYEYFLSEQSVQVINDRILEVVVDDDIALGDYRVGVEHPARGLVFWNNSLRLQNFRNIKFGPFGLYEYIPLWEPAAQKLRLTVNELLFVSVLVLLGLALTFTIFRLIHLVKETREIMENARALLCRGSLVSVRREELVMAMKKRGMGLRSKFIIALTSLVLIVILMISLFLGFSWLASGRQGLTDRLRKETALLLETLVSGARKSIPEASRTEILRLPNQKEAMGDDALWVTVTGPRAYLEAEELRTTSEGFDYLWASNDPEILRKLELPEKLDREQWDRIVNLIETEDETEVLGLVFSEGAEGGRVRNDTAPLELRMQAADILVRGGIMPGEINIGRYKLRDQLSQTIELLELEVERDLQEAGIEKLITEYETLSQEFTTTLDIRGYNFEDPEVIQLNEALITLNDTIENLFTEITNQNIYSVPELSPEDLNSQFFNRLLHRFFPERIELEFTNVDGAVPYVFYKPILYRVGNSSRYFHGVIRTAISVDSVLRDLSRIRSTIVLITIFGAVAAFFLGFLGAMILSRMMLRPITQLVNGLQRIRNEPDMLQHKDFNISLETRDELASLGDTINQMVRGLVQAAIANQELMVGREIQKSFIPLERGGDGLKHSIGGLKNDFIRIFGYYEGADAVSGDYFDFRQIDDEHILMIKCDIAGHGVSASLVMVVVSTLFVNYFQQLRKSSERGAKLTFRLNELAFNINELINEIGFQGRFAAFNLSVINTKTGEYWMTHAGDNLLHIYEKTQRKMRVYSLQEAPAAGQIDPMLLEMNPKAGYKQVVRKLNKGDVLFLFTDGIEESHHQFRDKDYSVIQFSNLPQEQREKDQNFVKAGMKAIGDDEVNEEFDTPRIHAVIEAVMHRGHYELLRRGDLVIGEPLHFDFTKLKGTADEAVLALASVEKLFRLVPDPNAGSGDRIQVDRKINSFLQEHFLEYRHYFRFPQDHDERSEYVWFSHLKEDKQDDDLTIWAIEKL